MLAPMSYDLDRDVSALKAMAQGLVPYVYQNELFGMTPDNLPKLTVGGLLMRLQRLAAMHDQLSTDQQATVHYAQQRVDEVEKEWHLALTGKIQWELKSRMDAIEQFLGECNENVRGCAESYPSTMEKRVIIQQLYDAADRMGELPDAIKTRLPALDNGIRRYIEAAQNFIWDERLEEAYPKQKYWYLYSRVAVPNKKKGE